MTHREALAVLKVLGCKARYSSELQEYRVTLHGLSPEREEAIAYYTDDPEDAIGTGIAMLETAKAA